jgi:hypothetical protein
VEFVSDIPLPILVVSLLSWVQLQRSCLRDLCNTLPLLLYAWRLPACITYSVCSQVLTASEGFPVAPLLLRGGQMDLVSPVATGW